MKVIPKRGPLRDSLAISPKVKAWGKWPLTSWPKLLLPPMMPTYRRSLGSKHFSRLCPETLAGSCFAGLSIRSRKPSSEALFFQSVEKDENCESGKIFAVETEPPEEGLKVEIKQIVKDCIKEM